MDRSLEDLWWPTKINRRTDPLGKRFASRAISEAKRVELSTIDRAQEIVNNYCLYGGFGAWGVTNLLTVRTPQLRRNVIATGVDTIVSELLQTPIRSMFVSRGGDWHQRRTAKKLTSWADDVAEVDGLHERRPVLYRDGLIAGTGWMRPRVVALEVKCSNVFPTNVLMDDRNCGDDKPRQIFVRSFIDKQHLMKTSEKLKDYSKAMKKHLEEVPDHSDSIWAFSDERDPSSTAQLAEVWECWHLESYKGAGDGVYAIVVDGCTLLREQYDRDEYPLVDYRPIKPTKGFWGISIVSRAGPLQVALNDMMQRIDEAMEYHARMVIIHPPAGGAFKQHMTNEAGTMAEHPTPERIRAFAPEPMPSQAYEHRDWLRQAILEEFAVNEMQAQGTKPTGLESGKALRVFVDTGARRFIDLKRSAERTDTRYMTERIHCMRQLVKLSPKAKVIYKRHGVPVEIDWKKIDPSDAHHRIQPFPASALPQDPAGRIQTLAEMRDDGTIDQETYYSLALDVPDFESSKDEYTAPIDFIRYQIDTMLEDNEPVEPWPTAPLERGISIANAIIMKEAMNDCPEERLDLVRDWIGRAEAHLKPPAPDPMMDPAMGGAPPMDPMMDPAMAGAMPPPMDPMMGGAPPMPPDPGMPMPGPVPEMMPPGMPPMAA